MVELDGWLASIYFTPLHLDQLCCSKRGEGRRGREENVVSLTSQTLLSPYYKRRKRVWNCGQSFVTAHNLCGTNKIICLQ